MRPSIGETIRAARKSRGLTADELGTLIGATGTSVLRWERGEVSPPLAQLEAVADALEMVLEVNLLAHDTYKRCASRGE